MLFVKRATLPFQGFHFYLLALRDGAKNYRIGPLSWLKASLLTQKKDGTRNGGNARHCSSIAVFFNNGRLFDFVAYLSLYPTPGANSPSMAQTAPGAGNKQDFPTQRDKRPL